MIPRYDADDTPTTVVAHIRYEQPSTTARRPLRAMLPWVGFGIVAVAVIAGTSMWASTLRAPESTLLVGAMPPVVPYSSPLSPSAPPAPDPSALPAALPAGGSTQAAEAAGVAVRSRAQRSAEPRTAVPPTTMPPAPAPAQVAAPAAPVAAQPSATRPSLLLDDAQPACDQAGPQLRQPAECSPAPTSTRPPAPAVQTGRAPVAPSTKPTEGP